MGGAIGKILGGPMALVAPKLDPVRQIAKKVGGPAANLIDPAGAMQGIHAPKAGDVLLTPASQSYQSAFDQEAERLKRRRLGTPAPTSTL